MYLRYYVQLLFPPTTPSCHLHHRSLAPPPPLSRTTTTTTTSSIILAASLNYHRYPNLSPQPSSLTPPHSLRVSRPVRAVWCFEPNQRAVPSHHPSSGHLSPSSKIGFSPLCSLSLVVFRLSYYSLFRLSYYYLSV